jgi:hypothetical protein
LEGQKAPHNIRTDIDNIELQASFEVAAKIRDYVLLEAKYLWEEKAPKVALALLELVSYVSENIHANIPKIDQWANINEKEIRMYSLVHLAKEISQNHTDFFRNTCAAPTRNFARDLKSHRTLGLTFKM